MKLPVLFVLLWLCAAAAAPVPGGRPLWLLAGAPDLVAAADGLAEHRRRQGYAVVVAPGAVADALRACPRRPDFLLIIGDDAAAPPAGARWLAPAKRGALYRWRSVQEESFATDSAWADTDGDGVPEFPVGRIPARDVAAVERAVRKTIAYESRALSPADLGLPIWAGTPASGKLLDEAATTMLLATVRRHAPAWAEPWVMFGNPRSPLSAHPPDQPALFNARLARGGLFSTMMGHGAPGLFHSQPSPGGDIDYHVGHARALRGGRPAAPLVIFACDCGRFDGAKISLAEALLFAPGGPVNVVAATTESHPLTNYHSALALLGEMGAGHRTFGGLWHSAQVAAFAARRPLVDALLKNAEGALDAEIDIAKLRRDHLLLYALLGDPATRIPRPLPLHVEMRPEGDGWRWQARPPHPDARLQVAVRRPSKPPHSKPENAPRAMAMRLFEARNAAWEFVEISTEWQGVVHGAGRLRLVATIADQIYAFTGELSE